jgi:hypothetical protein
MENHLPRSGVRVRALGGGCAAMSLPGTPPLALSEAQHFDWKQSYSGAVTLWIVPVAGFAYEYRDGQQVDTDDDPERIDRKDPSRDRWRPSGPRSGENGTPDAS